jgi:hypothetical protein
MPAQYATSAANGASGPSAARASRGPCVGAQPRRRQPRRHAFAGGAIGGVQIVDQDAPRHAVDDRVVNRQIQPRRAVRQPRRARAGERAAAEVEPALQCVEARKRIGFVARATSAAATRRTAARRRARQLPSAPRVKRWRNAS